MTDRRVHVTDRSGSLLFTRLIDRGLPILEFESGHGFVDRLDIVRYHWQIREGWPRTKKDRKNDFPP